MIRLRDLLKENKEKRDAGMVSGVEIGRAHV